MTRFDVFLRCLYLNRSFNGSVITNIKTQKTMNVDPLHVCSVLRDDQGHSYDLSPLAMDSRNWEVEPSTEDTKNRFFINVCRSLVQQGGQHARWLSFITCTCSVQLWLVALQFAFRESVLRLNVFWFQSKLTLCSPIDRYTEVSLQCSLLFEGRRGLCEFGAGGVWPHVGRERPEAAVHQRPGVSRRKAQTEQRHPL